MKREAIVNVTAPEELRGTVDTTQWPLDGSRKEVLLRLEDGRSLMVPAAALQRTSEGGYRLALAATDLRELSAALERAGAGERSVIPVVAEELILGKREVETGRVRVTKLVHEEERVVDQSLASEEVTVERVPVNRVVQGPVEVRQEGETMIVPLLEEVLVVEKRLTLREEVRITRRRSETHRPQTVTLRKEDVKIDRIPASAATDGTAVAPG